MKTLSKIAIVGLMVLPLLAGAQAVRPIDASSNPLQQILGFLDKATNWFLTILLVLAGIFIVYAAYLYLTAAGDETQFGKAKNTILFAIVAIVVGLLAKVIVALAKNFVTG